MYFSKVSPIFTFFGFIIIVDGINGGIERVLTKLPEKIYIETKLHYYKSVIKIAFTMQTGNKLVLTGEEMGKCFVLFQKLVQIHYNNTL